MAGALATSRAHSLLRAAGVALALLVAASAASTYTLRPGDTLSSVGRHFGVSVAALVSANHLANPNLVYAGEVLQLPNRGANPAAFGTLGTLTPGRLPPTLQAHPDRLALRARFRVWSARYGVPADLLQALAWMESGWQSRVHSPTGAIGIGQLEPSTVKFVSTVLLHHQLDPWAADANIQMTARFLRYLLDQTGGNVGQALAGYYQGLPSMARRGLMPDTLRYVADITALRAAFQPG